MCGPANACTSLGPPWEASLPNSWPAFCFSNRDWPRFTSWSRASASNLACACPCRSSQLLPDSCSGGATGVQSLCWSARNLRGMMDFQGYQFAAQANPIPCLCSSLHLACCCYLRKRSLTHSRAGLALLHMLTASSSESCLHCCQSWSLPGLAFQDTRPFDWAITEPFPGCYGMHASPFDGIRTQSPP